MVKSILVLWFGLCWSFFGVMHAKQIKESLSLFWKVNIYPLAIIGVVLDCVFNLTFGSLMFLELAQEFLFTERCKRHLKSRGYRGRLAKFWKVQLNAVDPGHIK